MNFRHRHDSTRDGLWGAIVHIRGLTDKGRSQDRETVLFRVLAASHQ
jgi:hypothetical protein